MPSDACGVTLPRLFVYDLPPTYRQCIDILRLLDKDGFPRVVHNSSDALPQLRLTHGYALGAVFLARVFNYTCLTRNASAADLFFVPVLAETPSCARKCAEASCSKNALFDRLTHLEAHGGRDHVLVSPRQGWREDLHPYYGVSFEDRRFGTAARFSAEEGAKYDWPVPATQAIFRSTPQASYVHMSSASGWDDVPWRSDHPRTNLVGWASNLRHQYGAFSTQLNSMREVLHRSCEAAKDKRVCTHLPLSPTPTYRKLFDLHLVQQTSSLYWNTTFCLQPIGDACTRKAIIDGLLLGCIPVLFHPCQHVQWPWHWGAWFHQASVSFNISLATTPITTRDAGVTTDVDHNQSSSISTPSNRIPVDVVDALRQISPLRIARMQRTIAEHAHCMHYAVPSTTRNEAFARHSGSQRARNHSHTGHNAEQLLQLGDVPDAFDITLQGAWHLALNGSSFVAPSGMPMRPDLGTTTSIYAAAVNRTLGDHAARASVSSPPTIWSALCRRVPVGPQWRAPICRTPGKKLCAMPEVSNL